jgi:hypothetical protein
VTTALTKIAEFLREVGAPGAFAARRTAVADDLHVEVKGFGRLRFPISRTAAQRLCKLARPARFGRGEQTLLDKRVRDTWEIPKSRVKIDRRRWNRTLVPMLDGLRSDLGLPDGCRLKAELHAVLVYSPGQFFLRHRDSEKDDEMVGTLVVTLPSRYKGGAFVIEHRGESITYRASRRPLSFVAFYADCDHQVRPVTEGYRIALTYNLLLDGDGGGAAAEPAPAAVDALTERLREHFTTPLPSRRTWEKDAPPRDPPNRLVCLLDHKYTERGLAWHRLKGEDAARAAVLRAAAERTGCETVLALAEVHETWDCLEPGWNDTRFRRRRRWARDDEDWYEDEPPAANDPDAYELGELLDQGITLDRWIDPSESAAEPIATRVESEELCFATPSSALEPYASEYEGYMGNYGNTMDRWYRRGAVVLWPRERAFAVRAEASPAWALDALNRRIRAGAMPESLEMAASLLPFWETAASRQERRGLLTKALRVAEGLDRQDMAASLLRPFRIEELTPARARAFVALVERYGEDWARDLVSGWSNPDRREMGRERSDRPAWFVSLPRLCDALRAVDGAAGVTAARLLLQDSWRWLKREIAARRRLAPPSRRDEALGALAKPILAFLQSAGTGDTIDLRDETIDCLTADENETLLPCLIQVLRVAAKTVKPALRAALGLDLMARHCARQLEARLALPARAEHDWSIVPPRDCPCALCGTLGEFLADPEARRLEWPLAKEGRRHIHGRLELHELPVRHETRRSSRPYTLVLAKTEALFEREADERRSRHADLAWLASQISARSPRSRPTS